MGQVSIQGQFRQLPVPDPTDACDLVRYLLDGFGLPLHNYHFEAVIMIQVNVDIDENGKTLGLF